MSYRKLSCVGVFFKREISMDKNEIEYKNTREEIKNGDILLYKGTGIVSNIIKKITHSEYSHAGLAVWWNDRLMVMEAVGKGVIVTPLSTNIECYHGDVEWFQCSQEISDANRLKMIKFAQAELGKRYSRWRILQIAFYIFLEKPFSENDTFFTSKRLFCSFYVASAYNLIKLDLKHNKADHFTTPDDIRRSPLLKIEGILKKYNKN